MFAVGNLGQFFSPATALANYKNMECSVPGETAVISVNRYRNADHPPETGGCQDALVIKDRLRGVAKDIWERAGGSVAYQQVFSGKGSPWAIAGVLEGFAAHADAFIRAYGKAKGTPEGKCAAILANDDISWQESLQQICNLYIGLDCNGFVGNWLMVVQPDLKLNYNVKSNNVLPKATAIRKSTSEIEDWDVMCYAHNEHIAAVDTVVKLGLDESSPRKFMVCQSAGGGPRMNEFSFIKGPRNAQGQTFKLSAPTKNDIGREFYVVSLW